MNIFEVEAVQTGPTLEQWDIEHDVLLTHTSSAIVIAMVGDSNALGDELGEWVFCD